VDHRDQILDQFTRQAVPFSTSPAIKDEQALRRVVELSGATRADTVLDVACGPGILACAFARVARHVTGIDLTPAMLERARVLATEQGLTNVTWQHADVLPLPFGDDDEKIRRLFEASLADDNLGIATRREGDSIHFGYPVAILVADR
jgi:2-polyprenyl-3-methyl-5-hydroxy-6-metoxy-1,4-benzoquinol methylase